MYLSRKGGTGEVMWAGVIIYRPTCLREPALQVRSSSQQVRGCNHRGGPEGQYTTDQDEDLNELEMYPRCSVQNTTTSLPWQQHQQVNLSSHVLVTTRSWPIYQADNNSLRSDRKHQRLYQKGT